MVINRTDVEGKSVSFKEQNYIIKTGYNHNWEITKYFFVRAVSQTEST